MREVGRRVSWGISLLLALAVSIDGFSVGFSCGLRRLVIPFTSLLAICLLSMAAVAVSLLAGSGGRAPCSRSTISRPSAGLF